MQNIKTNNIYFPLCLLNYIDNEDEEENMHSTFTILPDISTIAGKLISYGIVEYAKKLERSWSISQIEDYEICRHIQEQNLTTYQSSDPLDRYIILAAQCLRLKIGDLEITKLNHKHLDDFHYQFENVHGKDAKVKIHRDILFEVREKQFDERMFRVYCGVLSIIGKKPYVRITMKRILYAMLGCKSEKVFNEIEHKQKLLSARQVKTTIDKLRDRGFFDYVTHAKRMTFYSTKFRDPALNSVVSEGIAKNKLKKEKSKLKSEMLKNDIEEKLKVLRSEYLRKQNEPVQETGNMELFRYAGKC